MSEPQISVIIPARDAAPTLERTLEALSHQEFPGEFEVIVVDDGSRDDTPRIATAHAPQVSLIRLERGGGPGAARNHGARAARAPVLAFTDADCFPTPNWLARGWESLAGADLVQGRVEPDPSVPRTAFDRTLSVRGDRGFYQTANLFVRRETFEQVGGFHDWALERPGRRWSIDRRRQRATRTPIGEDTVFAWVALRNGSVSRYAPEALVHHAVIPGDVRDAAADRWHWTRDMPGLARLVPELRGTVFYRRWFFDYWTAQMDLALIGTCAAVLTRRPIWLAAWIPYARRVRQDAEGYRLGAGSGARRVAGYALGTLVVDSVTVAGLVAGSIDWRCLVL